MSDYSLCLLGALLRSGLVLSFSAVLVLSFLRLFPVASVRIRRITWFLVVLQGCLLMRIPVTIPASPLVAKSDRQASDRHTGESSSIVPRLATEIAASYLTTNVIPESLDKPQFPWARNSLWAIVLGLLWAVGIAICVVRSIWNYCQFIRQLPSGVDVPQDWKDEWSSLQRQAGLRRTASLRPTPHLGPLLCWHPRGYQLIVPADVWRLLGPQQRSMILQHELAHLKRGDIWKSLVLHLLALPHWFNPLVWCLVKRFDDDAELACDAAVCEAAPMQAISYARTLLLLGGPNSATFLTTQAVGGHGLADRIRRLIVPHVRKDSNMKKMAIVTIVLGISSLHLLRFQTQAEDQQLKPMVEAKGNAILIPAVESQANTLLINPAPSGVLLFNASGALNAVLPARTEAVVDMALLVKNLAEFEQAFEKLKWAIAEKEEAARQRQTELAELTAQLKTATANELDVKRQQLESRTAEYGTFRRNCVVELKRREEEIYLTFYEKITAELSAYAQENGIRVVRRVVQKTGETNLTPPAKSGSPVPSGKSPQNEIGGNGVSISQNSATPGGNSINVVGPGRVRVTGGGINLEAQTLTLGTSNGTFIITATQNSPASNGVAVEAGNETAGRTFVNVTANAAVATTNSSTKPFIRDGQSYDNAFEWMKQKEVLYSAPGHDFDITQEIITRMNAKYEKEQAAKSSK